MQHYDAILSSIELFKELQEDQLARVMQITTEYRFVRGDCIFMEGQPRDYVYFIVRGLVKIYRVDHEGREHIVNVLGRGQMFPHVGFFDDRPYPGTAEALTSVILYGIASHKFEQVLIDDPRIARSVMRMMGKMILTLQGKLREMVLFDARERVYALLRHFAQEVGTEMQDGIHFKMPITHTEIANMIGISRESVNRIWNDLRRVGTVTGDKEEWVLQNQFFDEISR